MTTGNEVEAGRQQVDSEQQQGGLGVRDNLVEAMKALGALQLDLAFTEEQRQALHRVEISVGHALVRWDDATALVNGA